MIYPEQFEAKIGFDRIRELVKSHCLFEPGRERVDEMEFLTRHEDIVRELLLVEEFGKIHQEEDEFPIQHFIDNREALKKAELEGTYLLTEEVFGLLKSLDSIRAILHFFKSDEEEKYPALGELCKPVKMFPFVQDRIQKILNKHGKIRDNASSVLHQIRRSQSEKQGRQQQYCQHHQAGASSSQGKSVIAPLPSQINHSGICQHDQQLPGGCVIVPMVGHQHHR